MKKHIIIISIILMVTLIGLSGCEQKENSSINIVSIDEILSHPNRYLNSSVTIRGFNSGYSIIPRQIFDPINGSYFIDYNIYTISADYPLNHLESIRGEIEHDDPMTNNVFINTEYYWTGIVISYDNEIRLEITDIQPV